MKHLSITLTDAMYNEVLNYKIEAPTQIIEAIRHGKEYRWIPVSERLPKKSGDYLCTFGGNNLTGVDHYTTELDAKKIFDEPEEYAGWRSQNVIAWQPLPEPYKAESEE